ncbi:MAG: precorrin-6B C5,15-methyltransferase / cobalt-precorrin-6B C5,C15-methyltransferase [Miltoncostaeaceae bacterium]|nr:precorrin-6B C5,15-methyltransferase / cobalt-precorrin-6B C5,C15-methyltransferase [Miltoncostaeaceae bacterium]
MGVTVVGIGADGWEGLGAAARAAVEDADLLIGGARHLGLVPDTGAERMPWPSPMSELLDRLPELSGRRVCVLATGDPMLHGVGTALARRVPIAVIPAPSAFSLACARLRWSEEDVDLLSLVHRPVEILHPALAPGRRAVVLTGSVEHPEAVAALLRDRGFGPSRLVRLEELGGPAERILEGTADDPPPGPVVPLHALAIEFRPGSAAGPLARVPGLPDEAFATDGQLTKREVRAVTLAALGPLPGELLWDVGAGSGSVGIEWMRAHPACRAIAIEARRDRVERAGANARALGVPGLQVLWGEAPAALADLDPPDAVFIGGGLTTPALVEACWHALRPGGRLVANAVTLEGEAELTRRRAALGGRLVRLEVAVAEPIGGFTGWRPHRPIVQWSVTKP